MLHILRHFGAGEIKEFAEKPGYWTQKYIYPVGFRSVRKYWNLQDATVKSDYECTIHEGEEGPVFRVAPLDSDGNVGSLYS